MTQSKQDKAIAIAMKNLGKTEPHTKRYEAKIEKLQEQFEDEGVLIDKIVTDEEKKLNEKFEKQFQIETEMEETAKKEALKSIRDEIKKNQAWKHPVIEYRKETKGKGTANEIEQAYLKGLLKEKLIELHTEPLVKIDNITKELAGSNEYSAMKKSGKVKMFDFLAEKDVFHNPNEVRVEKLGNNQIILTAKSMNGDHNNYRILDNFAPDGTNLVPFIKKIHTDRFGLGYEPENSLTTKLGNPSANKSRKDFVYVD